MTPAASLDAPAAPPPWDPWLASRAMLRVIAAGHEDAAGLARLRDERLRALLAAAAEGSPFWRARLAGLDPSRATVDQLPRLPVLGRRELMRHFDEAVTDPAVRLADLREFVRDPARIATGYLGRYLVWESSGSTGEPAVFVQDAAALAVYDALEALRRPGRLAPGRAWAAWAGESMAFVGAVDGHFASTVSIERLRALNPWMAHAVHGLSFLLPPAELAARLEALSPTVLATYPSMAVILAEAALAGRLRIAPREVWTGGETLGEAARALVERAFGATVVDGYGCSECLPLAGACAHGCLHLNADWAVLEPVDAAGRPVAPGEWGERVLLTNLANHLQPLVRYDLGDEVALDPAPCACGSALPVLRVRGRHDAPLDLPGRGGGRVAVSPLAACTVLEDEAGLFHFQLVQRGDALLELRAGDAPEEAGRLEDAARALRAFLAAQGAQGVCVRTRPDVAPVHGRSGKVARVVRA